MAKDTFMPREDNRKRDLLTNFAGKLAGYAATVGVSPAEVTATQADALFWAYLLDQKNEFTKFAQDCTNYKNIARDGGSTLGAMPVAPTLPAAPAVVPPDIFGRLGKLAARIKNHPGCTDAIARDLGIIGAEHVPMSRTASKPVLKVTLQAGHPIVGWKKGDADSLEIWVDRGDGKGFVLLAIDTIPDYTDTAALPAPGTSAVWKYKAIYRIADEQVGQWSDVVSITVAGA